MRPESIPLYKLAFTIFLGDWFGHEKPFLCENYDHSMLQKWLPSWNLDTNTQNLGFGSI